MKAAIRSPSPRNRQVVIPAAGVGCAGSSTGRRLSLRGRRARGRGPRTSDEGGSTHGTGPSAAARRLAP
jgi:hypothetical protein